MFEIVFSHYVAALIGFVAGWFVLSLLIAAKRN